MKTIPTPRPGTPLSVEFQNMKPTARAPKLKADTGFKKAEIFKGHQTLLRNHALLTEETGEPLS